MFSFVIFTVFLFVTWILFDFGIGVCQNLQSARGAETRCIYDHGRRRKKRGEKSLVAHMQELSLVGWDGCCLRRWPDGAASTSRRCGKKNTHLCRKSSELGLTAALCGGTVRALVRLTSIRQSSYNRDVFGKITDMDSRKNKCSSWETYPVAGRVFSLWLQAASRVASPY